MQNIDEITGIAWLTLNRPEKKNALSIALSLRLPQFFAPWPKNEKIRCIVTTGGGRFVFLRPRSLRYARAG
jgi:2-(1,2-epoxy-1,2-dihydrophenyl)acetyl-CoA isomerase